jgi:hypothetical protein
VLNYFLPNNLLAGSAASSQDRIHRPGDIPRPGEGLTARILGAMLLLFALGLPMCAQEFAPDHVVFPITDFKPDIKHLAPFSIKFGTGFCLDHDCRFVGTNYHVAKIMGKYVRIKGVFSAHRYLDSDPKDAGAQDVTLAQGVGSLKFTPAHDLAIYEMRHPLKHFHGIAFDDDLGNSTEVYIYAYPFNWNPKRGLVCWHGKFIGKTQQGLLAFSYEEGRVRGGASGGIVVDSKTDKIVGILNGVEEGKDRIALAVPVKELSDFVRRVQPYLQASLFPNTVFVSPVATDLYPPYVWPHSEGGLSQRPPEPPQVFELRRTAQHLADSMGNFSATETFAWGHNNREPEAADAYETLIVDGQQRWRRPGGKKFHDNVPSPPLNGSIVPGREWSYLPQLLGTDLDLKIHQAPDALLGGRSVHVFQYAADVEDRVCTITYAFPLLSWWGTTKSHSCHGEVWTDESGTILRISLTIDVSRSWHHWRGVMTYGSLEKDGAQYVVPVTLTEQVEYDRFPFKETFWCRGLFTDYQMFGVKTHLVLTSEREQ